MQVDKKSHVQAATALARTLRARGLVAAESAGTDGASRVLVFSRASAHLAEQVYVIPHSGKLRFWWSRDERLCIADDIDSAADKIAQAVMSETDVGVLQVRG